MKKHLKRFLSMMMAVLLCFGIVPSNAFAAEYDYDGYISMIDYIVQHPENDITELCWKPCLHFI